jgi:hypothetical protein
MSCARQRAPAAGRAVTLRAVTLRASVGTGRQRC